MASVTFLAFDWCWCWKVEPSQLVQYYHNITLHMTTSINYSNTTVTLDLLWTVPGWPYPDCPFVRVSLYTRVTAASRDCPGMAIYP